MRLTTVRVFVLAAVVLTVASTAFGAAVPTSVRLLAPPTSLTPGASATLRVKVAAGKHKTKAATVKVALSTDARLNPGDAVLASKRVGALKAHRSKTVSLSISIPSSAQLGSAYLLACIGKRCSAASLTVAAPPMTTGNGQFPASVPANVKGITPNPRSVTPAADTADAASGTITGEAGGTITATANGVTYRLDVPKAAVLSDVTVTMTPLSSVAGLPASGAFAGGVQLSPDGLQLLGSATLTITGAQGSSLAAFGYHGSGSNVGLLPLVSKNGSLVIPIAHFSGVAVGSSTSSDISGQVSHAPAGTADQLRQQLAVDLRTGNSAQLQADASAYWSQILVPKLNAALSDDSLAPAAMSEALSFSRMMELMGVSDYGTQAINYLVRILTNMYNHAYDRCVANHDPGEVRNMLSSLRGLELLGAGDDVDQTKADRCLTFHLDYQLTAHNVVDTANPLLEGTLDVSSMGNLMTFRVIGAALEADLPMTVNSWSWYDYLCNQTGGTATAATPAHAILMFSLNPTTGANGVITFGTPTFKLLFSPGSLTLTNACGLDGFSKTFYPSIWREPFKDLPVDPVTKAILVDKGEWTYQGGEIYATVDDQRTVSPAQDDNWTARLRFTLHHDPKPQ